MKQLALDDASAQWADVLARLRGSVLSVPRTTPAGWRLVEAYSAHAPCVPRRDARAGLYRCQRMTREVQEATGLNPNTVQSWFRKRWDIDQAFAAYLARPQGQAVKRAPKKPTAPPPPEWQTDGRLMEHHVDSYRHRRAVERAARKHGARLGDSYRMLLAVRLRMVDVDRDGCVPPLTACVRLVDRWSAEGRESR